MHTKIYISILVSLALAAASLSVDAKIYKTVDAQGNVVFTDVPPKDEQASIEIDLQNAYTPIATPTAVAPEPELDGNAMDATEVSYSALSITTPSEDESVRENAGNIVINIAATPSLDVSQGHTLQILMDGVIMTTEGGSSASLTNVDRGTHQVTAQILNAEGQIVMTSAPVTFHMLRHSALMGGGRAN